MQTSPPRIGYSIKEAIEVSSIKRTRLYELINSGALDVQRIGRRTIVRADSLSRLINGEAA